MSHVLAADYHVADADAWRARLRGYPEGLTRLGARHLVVYTAHDDPTHVFVTVGVDSREPLEALVRSGRILTMFDGGGVRDIPPLFIGGVEEKIEVTTAEDSPPGVVIASVGPVPDVSLLLERLHDELATGRASGVRRIWVYRAIDDGHEVMMLVGLDSLSDARRWLDRPEISVQWLASAGIGVYPQVFVGTLTHVVEAAD